MAKEFATAYLGDMRGRDFDGADGEEPAEELHILPITVCRNGYGRQMDSHDTHIDGYEVSFIRAPVIEDAGDCEVGHASGQAGLGAQGHAYGAAPSIRRSI